MNCLKTENGFSLCLDAIRFNFITPLTAEKCADLYAVTVKGDAPVPQILHGDRLILPVDEGLAVYAHEDYVAGELDVTDMHGGFCTREGTVGLVAVERQGNYLLICPENGLYADYRAVKKGELYDLIVGCDTEMRVFYGVYHSLKSLCDAYKQLKAVPSRTLAEKAATLPEAEKLLGGGVFWVWNENYDRVMYAQSECYDCPDTGARLLQVADELYQKGVDKALFGIFFSGDSALVETLYTKYGYIATQYDNYNDVLNPDLLNVVPGNRVRNCDYTRRRMKDYPDGVQVDEQGNLLPAWQLRGFDGKMYDQNTLCPLVAAQRIREEIPAILEQYPYYKGRFIDVYGGTLRPCFSKDHPVLTREDCMAVKRAAFRSMEDMGLLVGTEDGNELFVDELFYTEGLHSPVYFRIHDAGRNHAHIYNEEQKRHIDRHMLNPALRVPLWQLIYHDRLVSLPYWGDSTAMYPERIRDKILFACLYGCPPLYSFTVSTFEKYKDAIIDSYHQITRVTKRVSALPMTDYAVLKADYSLQRTQFGHEYEVIANFAEAEADYEGTPIPPKGYLFLQNGKPVK